MLVHSLTVQALVPRASTTLTSDRAIELVLADIPFFSVGLVAFAFFAFMLIMRRVNLLSIYLYSTALFSFGAVVLDLAQLLSRGNLNVDKGTGISSSITILMNIREVGFSAGTGLKYLFWWTFIAERPRGEPPPTANFSDPKAYFYYAENSHSARWDRWGHLGIFLKYILLAAILSIPILQIIWRIAVRHFGTVYMLESTVEILVTALFILKVFLNVFLSPESPWWKPFRFYGVPLIALLINLALSIGQLAHFSFSESTLGRFLQAIEVYIMIIFLLVVAFYKIPVRPTRPSSIQMSDEKPQDLRSPTMPFAPSGALPTSEEPQSRTSMVSRVSSWILAPRLKSRERRMSEDVEAGPGSNEAGFIIVSPPPVQPVVAESSHMAIRESGQQNAPTSPSPNIPHNSIPFIDPIAPVPVDTPSVLLSELDQRTDRPYTGVSLRYYGLSRDSLLSLSPPNPAFIADDTRSFNSSRTESPVYGLDGIVRQKRNSIGSSLARTREPSISSFDELIQQQAELDRSIAALRLFSPPSMEEALPEGLSPQEEEPGRSANSRINRTISSATTSSARSEFSLSVFPDPPTVGVEPPRTSLAAIRAKRARLSRRDVPSSFDLNGSIDSLHAPIGLVLGRSTGSNATLYDVTSFIGDLTLPSSSRPLTSEVVDSSTSLRPLALTAEIPPKPEIENSQEEEPLANEARDQGIADDEDKDVNTIAELTRKTSYPQLRPFFLGNVTSAPAVSSPLTTAGSRAPSAAPVGPRKPATGRLALPSQPKLAISGPRPSSVNQNQAPGAFESPRPPPSFPSGNIA
ncbi:hypothetical protein BDP27DRAFT_1327922 [Rhodocollybia butyracea]|uniref:Uncharacterized protein n=1 Tax=Rhodocollybia butyracea TaxID=206335 RepID=A0A9P5PU87_9AGAR|nr:hypothetical protein BDP27DRAFT_1327922 [Rhodocollybia butyracea]